jgi:hypothetical protein
MSVSYFTKSFNFRFSMNKKYIIAFVAAMMLATGCEKDLEQTNPNQQTSATFWQSQDDAIKGVNAAYQTLIIDGGYMRSTLYCSILGAMILRVIALGIKCTIQESLP